MPENLSYLDRAQTELNDLWDKIYKLSCFLETVEFTKLPGRERMLLQEQRRVMEHYSFLLRSRLGE